MRRITYHVATTLDGYIAHSDHTTEGFSFEGPHVSEYLQHLQEYDTVIMGRKTYEAGYQFGLKAGEAPYPWMRNFIFSKSIEIQNIQKDKLFVIRENWQEAIKELKSTAGSDIYLCGGGKLAGLLLAAGLVDRLRLKVAPLIFGSGIKLFDAVDINEKFKLDNITRYSSDTFLAEYSKV
ncbi:MAG: dihydrofolate reductase family protein [Spirochaetota bacterium]